MPQMEHALRTVTDRIAAARADNTPLRLRGGGSKDFLGVSHGELLDTRSLSGVISYEPTELVVTVGAGTLLIELEALLAENGGVRALTAEESDALWAQVRALSPLADGRPLWRINTAPSACPAVIAALEMLDARWLMDWAGGLIWLTLDGAPGAVRAATSLARMMSQPVARCGPCCSSEAMGMSRMALAEARARTSAAVRRIHSISSVIADLRSVTLGHAEYGRALRR